MTRLLLLRIFLRWRKDTRELKLKQFNEEFYAWWNEWNKSQRETL